MISVNKLFRSTAVALMLLCTTGASAQLDFTETWIQTWVRVVAVGEGCRVAATQIDGSTSAVYRETLDWKTQLPVMSSAAALFSGHARAAEGYAFVGWYVDDGDGVFDAEKDEYAGGYSDDGTLIAIDMQFFGEEYATRDEAKKAAVPTAPQATVFAFFSNGVSVSVSEKQAQEYDWYPYAGAVDIDKFPNAPGDVVTVEAFPADGYEFAYWRTNYYTEDPQGKVVSTANPYTFTVTSGETLYAVFRDLEAPSYDFPEEGGWKAVNLNANWVLDDISDCTVYIFNPDDIQRADGRVLLNTDDEEAQLKFAQWQGLPTLMYGKGRVNFLFRWPYGFSRENPIVQWAANGGATINGSATDDVPHYVYVFKEDVGAFILWGHTDFIWHPEEAQTTIKVPANTAYINMLASDLTDDEGNIPSVIALSAESYDYALAHLNELITGVETLPSRSEANVADTKIYTLGGVSVRATAQPGIYIVNGKKVAIQR